ncbi:MAG: MBL fold metallo-hydrolase [Deltaproteobacteria bacterium]|nr:MBL fold metallo-hydrolase [Deltaproteobacteria bacterium]MBW2118758.1 MBL fold metallo-hydrolase [Deltaproteobacteria bacterium]MBW2344537.1 MBL fold metallo-hydrolase [Deltaproteobacteria bacterium]
MKFCVLASGSKGNSCYVETGNASILIDAGLSCREIVKRLGQVGVRPEGLDALIITHEHTDHIKGAGPLIRRFGLPLYINKKTLEKGLRTFGKLSSPVVIESGQTVTIKDLSFETFTKCHDAADPVGLILTCSGVSSTSNGKRIGLATDLGRSTRLVEDRLKGCNALIMEFNYDLEMLELGPYPLDLKRRIKGQDGHLSNKQAGDLLGAISHDNLEFVVLAHLSETNNDPDKAHEEAAKALSKSGHSQVSILISRQDEPGPLIEL